MKVESRIDRKTIQKRQSRPPPPPNRFAGLKAFGCGRLPLSSTAPSAGLFSEAGVAFWTKASDAALPQSTSGVVEGLLQSVDDSGPVPNPPGR